MEVDERIVRCEEYWTVHFGSQVVAGELSKKGRQYLQNELNKAFRKCTRAVSQDDPACAPIRDVPC